MRAYGSLPDGITEGRFPARQARGQSVMYMFGAMLCLGVVVSSRLSVPRVVFSEVVSGSAATNQTAKTSGADGDDAPHILLVIIDDQGWNDAGYQSTDLEAASPVMNTLASDGIKLSNYYTNYICSPSRASLLTGLHAAQLGMQHCAISYDSPWGLGLNFTTLPQMMAAFLGCLLA